MSKITDFQAKKAELQAAKLLTTIDLSQVVFEAGGPAAQFICNGMTPGQVKSLVTYLKSKQTQILSAIKDDLRAECEALRLEALAEADSFAKQNNTAVL